MKTLVFAMSLLSSIVALGDVTPIVTKVSGGGFVPPAYVRTEKCEVYTDKVVVSHYYGYASQGGAVVTETKNIQFEGDVKAILEQTGKEEVQKKGNAPCDGPVTSIVAGKDTLLFETGGCGSPRQERVGTNSRMLTEIVNLYCPKSYDFGVRE